MPHIQLIIDECKPILLCCTEARVTDDIYEKEIHIDGYYTVRSNSHSRHSGGVVVYVKNGTVSQVLEDKCFLYNNVLVLDVMNNQCRGIWFVVYHSPNHSHTDFLNEIDGLIDRYSTLQRNMNVTGDLNIDLSANGRHDANAQRLMRMARSYSMKQIVNKPTRITSASKTIIDHFYTDDKNYSIDVTKCDCIADHRAIIIYKMNKSKEYDFKRIIDRKLCVHENIVSSLNLEKLNYHPSNDLNYNLNYIRESIERTANHLTSTKYISVSYAKRWYTPELHSLRVEKDAAHMRAQLTDNPLDWSFYRQIRNRYNKAINKERDDDIKMSIIDCGNDKRMLWRCLKRQIGNQKELPSCMNINNIIITDGSRIAHELNDFFIESIEQINESIPHVPYYDSVSDVDAHNWSNFEMTTEKELYDILKSIRTKSGINNVNKSVVISSFDVFGCEITRLFNESLKQGLVPDSFKSTLVSPIPKIKDTCKAEQMRPINQAEVLDKMLQTIVKNQLQKHVDQQNLLSPNQSAYRDKHSCETALNLVLAQWKSAKERNKKIVAVFLDLSRAFETIDRNLLLKILKKKGIGGNVYKWFESFLDKRRQKTQYKEFTSDESFVKIGVPQGTPLSSLLFILYIDDVAKLLKFCEINLFADDMLIWIAEDDINDAIDKINYDLAVILNYLCMMRLKVNISKTKYMLIGKDSERQVVIDGQQIERVIEMKYLGIIVDNKLTFKSNIEQLIKKISKKIYMLRRLKNRTDFDTRLLLYKSLVAPHYDYCSTILFLASATELERLQKLQNRAMRIIVNAGSRDHIVDLLQRCDLLNVKQRVYFNVLCFMYKMKNGQLPQYLSRLFRTTAEVQPYDLRGNNLLRPPTYLSTSAQNSIEYKGAVEFNKMLQSGVNINCPIEEFRKSLASYVKSTLE